jgi:uncharacterized protein YeaO (DUF488 family)
MLRETYIANWNKVNGKKIRVARPSVLSPSLKLFKDFKGGKITWEEYEERFKSEILQNPTAMQRLIEIKDLSKIEDVFLICYEKKPPCHRFILMDIIKGL